MFTVRLLGGFSAQIDGKPVRIKRSHAQQLLAYLMVERGRSVTRELFGSLFWPEADRKSQLTQFRHVLMALETNLGKHGYILKPTPRTLAFNTVLPHTLDVAPLLACETAPMDGKTADELLVLTASYQPFLPEFDDEWVIGQRSRLETLHDERILRTLVERLLANQSWVLLTNWGHRAIACPSNQGYEPVYRAVMHAEYQLHNPKGVSDTYAQLQAALDDMGLVPSRTTRELYDRLLRELEPLLPEAPPPAAQLITPIRTQNLPTLHLPDFLLNPPTPLIGRETLQKRVVHDLSDPNRQLITLLGIGGIGKTRLAAAAAIAASSHFADGVYFVEADAATSAESFYMLLAERLHFSPYGQASLRQQVQDFLREKKVLLLVDNFETLLELENDDEGASLIEELCAKAPSLKVLVTTRQSLQLLRETVFDVDGLDVPADAEQPDAATYGAVALFAEIAGRVNDGFSLTRELPAVVSICHLVGGTPLALEISAALVRGMSCTQIAARIVENLDALISQWRNVSPRQRSLRAVLEYAFSLLAPNEQTVFARASAFVGGFTQEAAHEVVGATHSALRALKDCALVRQDSAARFFMHSFVRQFSGEKLALLAQTEPTQRNLARYFLAYAQQHTQAQMATVSELTPEWGNLLEGMRLSQTHRAWPTVLAFADTLTEPWYIAARYADIRQGMAWACTAAEALGDERAQSRFLSHWGRACVRQGDYAEADGYFERGLALAWKLIDSPSIARVLYERAQLLIERSELKAADEMLDECLEIYEELGDTLGMVEGLRQKARLLYHTDRFSSALNFADRAYGLLGQGSHIPLQIRLLRLSADIVRELGDYPNARQLCDRAIQLCSQLPDQRELGLLYYSLSQINRVAKCWSAASNEAHHSLELLRNIGDRKSVVHVITQLGYITMDQEQWRPANEYIAQAISILRELNDLQSLIRPLLRLGQIQRKLNDEEQARQAFEEGLRLAEQFDHPLASTLREKLD